MKVKELKEDQVIRISDNQMGTVQRINPLPLGGFIVMLLKEFYYPILLTSEQEIEVIK